MATEIDLRSSSNELSSAPTSDLDTTPIPSRSTSIQYTKTASISKPSHLIHSHDLYGSLPAAGGETVNASATRHDSAPKVVKPRKKREPADPNAPPKEKKPRKPRADGALKEKPAKKRKTDQVDLTTPTSSHVSAHPTDLKSSILNQPTQFHHGLDSVAHDAARVQSLGSLTQATSSTLGRPQIPSPTTAAGPSSTPRASFDPIRNEMRTTSSYLTAPVTISHTSTLVAESKTTPELTRPRNEQSTTPQQTKIEFPKRPPLGDSTNTRLSVIQIDSENEADPTKALLLSSSSEAEKKTKRTKETSPPTVSMGTGMLAAHFFGGPVEANDQTEKGRSISLQINLSAPGNNVINFARMAEEKYGFAALHPRIAAQRKRMAEVAAAGALLEKHEKSRKTGTAAESNDEDISVDIDIDIDKDSDEDGDVAMTGQAGMGENSGTDTGKKKRRRRVEDYDLEDEFVDDSEMVWEQQAAASKDGFFVYCGPLVPEGEKPVVERAEGTSKRGVGRGRGRGGGPGSRGGRGTAAAAARAATAATAAAAASGKEGTPAISTRGRGVPRGPRKPKTDREEFKQKQVATTKDVSMAS